AGAQNSAFETLKSTLIALGDTSPLESAAARLLKPWRAGLPPDDPMFVLALSNLAGYMRQNGKTAEARKIYQEAVALCVRRPREIDSWMQGRAFDGLRELLAQPDDDAALEALDRQRLTNLRATLPAEDPGLIVPLTNLAGTLR